MKIDWYDFPELASEEVKGYGLGFSYKVDGARVEFEVWETPQENEPDVPIKLLSIFVKWDGCAETFIAKEDCFHTCGADQFKQRFDLICRVVFKVADDVLEYSEIEPTDDKPAVRIYRPWLPEVFNE